ncbi:MAG: 23S rRNA (adenine(2030)-N(6))-methyltransferase RlmJ [Tatlockia sp.]|nr:23S rRNA (adenine(2030)-N(6))-methyltransferase RlmJ [Tatlockia sp.]
MLSYQHGYHAGGFADVVKHLTLSRLLKYMTEKEKPLFYLETHSGRGGYDLFDQQASKTKEYGEGIELLWKQKDKLPTLFSPYIEIIGDLNTSKKLRYYPGSPCLAINLLREQDRIYCCELHPREFEHLESLHHAGKRVFCSHSDGVASLGSLLPPPERRGLIFIDPSFEIKTEYKLIPKAIKAAYQRFSTGVFCLWYPLVDNYYHEQLLRNMQAIGAKSNLRIEFNLNSGQEGMTGCGLWIINPPYVLCEELKLGLKHLTTVFNPGKSTFLVNELNCD